MIRKNKLFLLILMILLVFGILVVFVFDINCLFKSYLSIPCPGCGLTRSFRCLFKGDIISALNYNILSIFIFIFLILLFIFLIIDFIKKSNYLDRYMHFFVKYYWCIIILVIISWIINIIRDI